MTAQDVYIHKHIEALEQYKKEFKGLIYRVTEEQLNWKPNVKAWSIGECLSHIIVTNQRYFAVFDAALQEKRTKTFWEKLPFWPKIFGNMIKKAVQPDMTNKSKTKKVFQPTESYVNHTVFLDFCVVQDMIKDYFNQLKGLNLEKEIVTSPVSSMITYSLQDVVQILVDHEKRHFNQANALTNHIAFPPVAGQDIPTAPADS